MFVEFPVELFGNADPDRRVGGRGAYLHLHPRCWALAVRRRAVPRALRLPADRSAAVARDLPRLADEFGMGIELMDTPS